MREYIIHSPLHPQAVEGCAACVCARLRVCVRSGGMDGIGEKVEVEEEDLHIAESGGEKGGGITAVPLVPRGGGETEKNEISRIARQWDETRRSASGE